MDELEAWFKAQRARCVNALGHHQRVVEAARVGVHDADSDGRRDSWWCTVAGVGHGAQRTGLRQIDGQPGPVQLVITRQKW